MSAREDFAAVLCVAFGSLVPCRLLQHCHLLSPKGQLKMYKYMAQAESSVHQRWTMQCAAWLQLALISSAYVTCIFPTLDNMVAV